MAWRGEVVEHDVVGAEGRVARTRRECEFDAALFVQRSIDDLGTDLARGVGEVEAEVVGVTEVAEYAGQECRSFGVVDRRAKHEQTVHVGVEDGVEIAEFDALCDCLDQVGPRAVGSSNATAGEHAF